MPEILLARQGDRGTGGQKRTFATMMRGASDRFHVLSCQMVGGMGAGKTTALSWLADRCFPDYEPIYTQGASLWEQVRIMSKGVPGKTKYFFAIDDASFIFQRSNSREHSMDVFQNQLTRIRHNIAKAADVDKDALRIVIVWSHHYLRSISPYLREAQVQLLGSLYDDEQKKRWMGIFNVWDLKRYQEEYADYMDTSESLLQNKKKAPWLCRVLMRTFSIDFVKVGLDITRYRVNRESNVMEDYMEQTVGYNADGKPVTNHHVEGWYAACQYYDLITRIEQEQLDVNFRKNKAIRESAFAKLENKPELKPRLIKPELE